MPSYEASRTVVKSPPELWAELHGGARLAAAIDGATVQATEHEKDRKSVV